MVIFLYHARSYTTLPLGIVAPEKSGHWSSKSGQHKNASCGKI